MQCFRNKHHLNSIANNQNVTYKASSVVANSFASTVNIGPSSVGWDLSGWHEAKRRSIVAVASGTLVPCPSINEANANDGIGYGFFKQLALKWPNRPHRKHRSLHFVHWGGRWDPPKITHLFEVRNAQDPQDLVCEQRHFRGFTKRQASHRSLLLLLMIQKLLLLPQYIPH